MLVDKDAVKLGVYGELTFGVCSILGFSHLLHAAWTGGPGLGAPGEIAIAAALSWCLLRGGLAAYVMLTGILDE